MRYLLPALLVVFCLLPATVTSADERPNFVWILSEDNSQHFLKLFHPDGAETPNIAQLAAEGLIYENAYSNAPVCSVARTTLITSCYAPRIGTFHHRKSFLVPLPGKLKMFPAYLRDAGYYTTNNSKKDYNAKESPGTWDQSSGKATWRNRQPGQPFFHMHTFGTTHESSLHFSAAQMQKSDTKTEPDRVPLAPYHPDTPTFRYTYARYHDNIMRVDQQIGQLVDQLREDDLLDSTFVFYFADHGGVLPRGKGYAYETGLHVPLVVRVPEKFRQRIDHPVGSRIERIVSFVDFGPTLLSLAGIEVPSEVDGKPFLGAAARPGDDSGRSFGHADRFDEKYDMVRTLRVGKFHYVRNFQPFNFDGLRNNYRYKMLAYQEWLKLYQDGQLNEVQRQFFEPRPAEMLFDVEQDGYEVHDLSRDPRHQETLVRLRNELSQQLREMPDLGFYPESVLAGEAADDPVKFGQRHQPEIARLVEIANLQLLPFEDAQEEIAAALKSNNPWQRYWGLIVCSAFGEPATALSVRIQEMAQSDPVNLVRVRAAEFLALTSSYDAWPVLRETLRNAQSATEANLILNTVVLLRDGFGKKLPVTADDVRHLNEGRGELERRLEYLAP